ncbi:MAG: hypothetical protein R3B53_03535 [Candidatus Paceibacterota bacterium]
MKTNIRPIIFLILVTMLLPELLTGSTSLSAFLDIPRLIILFFGYGLAVLLIREVAVRYDLSVIGIFILGIAYGLFNEGFIAKTLIKVSELPMVQYDYYGYFLGISFPFAVTISFWHALASVTIPILLAYYFFPTFKAQPWLSKKTTVITAGVVFLLGVGAYFGAEPVAGAWPQLLVLLVLMLGFFLLAKRFKETTDFANVSVLNYKPLWLGISLFPTYFLLLIIIAGTKLPLALFFGVFTTIILGYYFILRRNGWLSTRGFILFGIGNYLQNAIIASVLAFTLPDTLGERILAGVVAVIFLIWLARRVKNAPVVSGII